MQVLSAQQAPQSSTYNSNLAKSTVQLIGLGVNGRTLPPNAASALVAILQVIFSQLPVFKYCQRAALLGLALLILSTQTK